MADKELFPDYEPKRTPDTIFDFGIPSDSKLNTIFEKLEVDKRDNFPIMELKQLKKALQIFREYENEAEKNPGGYRKGNLILGAPKKEYISSVAALIVSELGKLLRNLMKNIPSSQIQEYKEKNKISDQELIYNEIYFTHSDVMGSGRFFYAERKKEKVSINL